MVRLLTPNKSDAPNPAMTPQFQIGSHWRGVGDPHRSALCLISIFYERPV